MYVRRIALAMLLVSAAHAAALAQSNDFVLPDPSGAFEEPIASRVAAIAAPALAAHIEALASPSMEGRGLGTRGLDGATDYVVAALKLAGIAPYGTGGGYFQPLPVRQLSGTTGTVEVERRSGEQLVTRSFADGVDALFSAQPPQTLEAPVVFAGYGIRESSPRRDDYAGLDVRGRIVMLLGGLPPGEQWQTAGLRDRYGAEGVRQRYAAKLELARELGAAAVLAVEGDDFPLKMAGNLADEERAFRSYDHEAVHEPPMLIRVSRSVACAVLGAEPERLPLPAPQRGEPREKTATRATIRVSGEEKLIVARNVLAVLPGSDPILKDEAVILGAHLDHLGAPGGVVHAGADDNASGVAALLEVARVFAAPETRPKRTIVFAFWTGEEEGRFGSAYYVKHPLWPLARTVAYLNLDMIGHPWLPEEIRKLAADNGVDPAPYLASPATFVEPGVPRGVPALETALRNSARGNRLAMHFDWTDGKNGGSDYRDFARAGVPFIRFFGNFFPGYHTPQDTSVDPAQVERVARFAFAAAWELAGR